MTTTRIGSSDLEIFPLALGGNVFGWTADRDASFAVLDAFTEAGGTLIDTADSYSHWVPGHSGGESERTIGEWIAARKPQGVQLATKVGMQPGGPQLTASNVRAVAEQSLQRLGVETIDLFYAHKPDDVTPLEETVAAFDALVRDGLIRNIGLSNYSAEQVEQWLDIAEHTGAAKPVALQPQYSLVHRGDVEGPLLATAQRHELSILPYYSLASGFLTGKYREPVEAGESPRAGGASQYATAEGLRIIDELERIASEHGASIASTALAWLRQQPTVAAPIASASKPSQIAGLVASATLELTDAELASLSEVSSALLPA
ncbi:aldo/keto reductase [Gulosibacter sp. ACHW.36C]|uniref:Aldo/keto reductase n=1 Tax=Gulosibacter sediminis TaxID=1729695 RepID=A0ABY4MXI8_9MICO|nr:aldo/keto reductase [Gulosibacter sediminis]UQN15140.1 aldo/keto reductase [Gulosibacter sediminis]